MRTNRWHAPRHASEPLELLDGTRPESPQRRDRQPARWVLAALALTAGVGGIVAVAQQAASDKGKAQVVERRGPEIEVQPNGRGHVIVLFPQAGDGTHPQGDVEVVLVESQMSPPAADGQNAGGQPATPGTAAPTGREIVFSSRDASEGLVRHAIDASGNGRKMTVLARVGGKYVEARQGGGEGVTVFTVQMPAKQPDAAATQQPAAGAAGEAAGGDANATPPAEGQPATPATPAQAAVILIYAGAAS